MEKIITGEHNGKRFSAILTKNRPECKNGDDHQWDGEEIMTFHNDERILKSGEFNALPEEERKKLSVASGEISCSKCGIGYMTYDNPFYSEI